MTTITVKCNLCTTIITGPDLLQALRESDYHHATAHPPVTEAKENGK